METTIGSYLINQLHSHGIKDIFGIPGDYVLGLYGLLQKSPIRIVTTCDEQGAGFAADAYARIKGLGAVCVTYSVGGLKVANTTAQAYAEESPVLVISGAPGVSERINNPLLHHKVRNFDTQKKIFDELTVASAVLDNPDTALAEIDRVIHAVERYKRPGYLELPRDMLNVLGNSCHTHVDLPWLSDWGALAESVEETVQMLNAAEKPVIIAGEELQRYGLQALATGIAEKFNIPLASTIMGKSVVPESHPLYMGVYEGMLGHEEVCSYVESSDCIIFLGALLSDFNLGLFSAKLEQARTIAVNADRILIKYHRYEDVLFGDYLEKLISAPVRKKAAAEIPRPVKPSSLIPERGKKLSMSYLFRRVNSLLDRDMMLFPDIGEAFFGSLDLYVERPDSIIASAYYTTLGFAVPAALGAQIADPAIRPLVLVGDGAFQMTGLELSSCARYNLNPIILVINNSGYGTERPMLDGPFNDLFPWKYSRITEMLGTGKGFVAETESDLETAIGEAMENKKGVSILDIRLEKEDRTTVMERLTERLARRVGKVPLKAGV